MRTSDSPRDPRRTTWRRALQAALLGSLASLTFASTHCASMACDQYSDCPQGYTCAAGMCVLPPAPPDASADAVADRAAETGRHSEGGVREAGDASDSGTTHDAADASDASHDAPADVLREGATSDAPARDGSLEGASPESGAHDSGAGG